MMIDVYWWWCDAHDVDVLVHARAGVILFIFGQFDSDFKVEEHHINLNTISRWLTFELNNIYAWCEYISLWLILKPHFVYCGPWVKYMYCGPYKLIYYDLAIDVYQTGHDDWWLMSPPWWLMSPPWWLMSPPWLMSRLCLWLMSRLCMMSDVQPMMMLEYWWLIWLLMTPPPFVLIMTTVQYLSV